MNIRIEALSKSFGEYRVLDGLSLGFASGELVALGWPLGFGQDHLAAPPGRAGNAGGGPGDLR